MKRFIFAAILIFVLTTNAYAMGSLFGGRGGGGRSTPASTGGDHPASGQNNANNGNNSNSAGGSGSSMAVSAGGMNHGSSTGSGTDENNNNTTGDTGIILADASFGISVIDHNTPGPASVPEPSMMMLLGSCGFVLWYVRRKTKG